MGLLTQTHFVNSPLSWFGLEWPCTDSAKSQSKYTSSSMSVLTLPLSILQTKKKKKENRNTAWFKNQKGYTESMVFIVLLTRSGDMNFLRFLSKERARETWNIWMQAGRQFSAVTRLHSPLGPYLQHTFTAPWWQRWLGEVDYYCYPCSRCLLFLMRERKKTRSEKFRCVQVTGYCLCLVQLAVPEG